MFRHLAVVGALVILGLTALDFFIQQLVHQPIRYWVDDLHQVMPNNNAVSAFNRTVQEYLNDPDATTFTGFQGDLQVARISNTTTYNPQNVGDAPRKLDSISS